MLVNGEYRTAEMDGITVTAVPACNQNHSIDKCVGYLIRVDGVLIYASGDTSRTAFMDSMAGMGIDYALLPTDGFYNMGL